MDRGEFAVEMVLEALELYEDEGREETVRFYNTPESTDGEWYVFIIDESDEIIAHANPNLLGEDLKGDLFVGAEGYPLRRVDSRRHRPRALGGLLV